MDLFFHFSPTPILICIAYILAVCCRTVLSNLFVMRAKLKIKFVGCKISLPPPVPPACHHGETSRDVWHDWFHCKMPLLVFPSWRGGGKGVCCAPPPPCGQACRDVLQWNSTHNGMSGREELFYEGQVPLLNDTPTAYPLHCGEASRDCLHD